MAQLLQYSTRLIVCQTCRVLAACEAEGGAAQRPFEGGRYLAAPEAITHEIWCRFPLAVLHMVVWLDTRRLTRLCKLPQIW